MRSPRHSGPGPGQVLISQWFEHDLNCDFCNSERTYYQTWEWDDRKDVKYECRECHEEWWDSDFAEPK